jgi:hypothetical protein
VVVVVVPAVDLLLLLLLMLPDQLPVPTLPDQVAQLISTRILLLLLPLFK